jgi:hypothetical protein
MSGPVRDSTLLNRICIDPRLCSDTPMLSSAFQA